MKDPREELHKRGLNAWHRNGFRGILQYGTGSGKSWCGIRAMDHFYKLDKDAQFLIVIPRTTLIENWKTEIKKAKKTYLLKNIVFSTYHSILNHVNYYDLAILDEVHHVTSMQRMKFFFNTKTERLLGLTAKLSMQQKYKLISFLKIVDTYSIEEAKDDGIVADHVIFTLPVYLTIDEKLAYKACTDKQGAFLNRTKGRTSWKAIGERKKIIYNSEEKFRLLPEIVELFKEEYGVIFSLSIDNAKKVEESIEDCKAIHSKLSGKKVAEIIKDFSDGRTKTRILSTPTMLDEGITLPRLTFEILLDRFSKERQSLQTVGRGVRLEKDKNKLAIIVRLYCKNTVEEKWVQESFKSFSTIEVNSVEELKQQIQERREAKVS